MEEDRAETNLGIAQDAAASAEPAEVPRVPKKRFVGRKTAAENAAKSSNGASNGTIEDSGAIQGIYHETRRST